MMRETKAAMADTGVGVFDIEFVKITPKSMLQPSSLSWRQAPNSVPNA